MARQYVSVMLLVSAFLVAQEPDGAWESRIAWWHTVAQSFVDTFEGAQSAFGYAINGVRGKQLIKGPLQEFNDNIKSVPVTHRLEGFWIPAQEMEQRERPLMLAGLPVSFATQTLLKDEDIGREFVYWSAAKQLDVPVRSQDYVYVGQGCHSVGWEIDQEACQKRRDELIESQKRLMPRIRALGVSFVRWLAARDMPFQERVAASVGRLLALYTAAAAVVSVSCVIAHYCSGDDAERDEVSVEHTSVDI